MRCAAANSGVRNSRLDGSRRRRRDDHKVARESVNDDPSAAAGAAGCGVTSSERASAGGATAGGRPASSLSTTSVWPLEPSPRDRGTAEVDHGRRTPTHNVETLASPTVWYLAVAGEELGEPERPSGESSSLLYHLLLSALCGSAAAAAIKPGGDSGVSMPAEVAVGRTRVYHGIAKGCTSAASSRIIVFKSQRTIDAGLGGVRRASPSTPTGRGAAGAREPGRGQQATSVW